MIIGVTGNSGSGKTEVCKILAENYNDAQIIDADKIAKELSIKGTDYFKEITKIFGKEILKENGELNRKKIAEIIYTNKQQMEKLNDITNKYVVNEINNRINKATSKIIILDVPLLIESNLNKKCNIVIGVIAEEKIKIDRICKRDLIDTKMAKLRLNIQPDNSFYEKNCTYIIENNKEGLKEKIREIMRKEEKFDVQ
jgi:dephospho-CoA kinase